MPQCGPKKTKDREKKIIFTISKSPEMYRKVYKTLEKDQAPAPLG